MREKNKTEKKSLRSRYFGYTNRHTHSYWIALYTNVVEAIGKKMLAHMFIKYFTPPMSTCSPILNSILWLSTESCSASAIKSHCKMVIIINDWNDTAGNDTLSVYSIFIQPRFTPSLKYLLATFLFIIVSVVSKKIQKL